MEKITWMSGVRNINDLKPYEHNPRKITKKEMDRLKASLEESGYNAPILIDEDHTIIAGHQRWEVLKELGYQEVDVRFPNRKLTEKEYQRINVQDNVSFGEWDMAVLEEFFNLEDLEEWGVPEEFLDFDETVTAGLTDDDAVPEAGEIPKSKIGDIYILGESRLMCGDSTNPEHVKLLLDGQSPNTMITDPPYGVKYEADWRAKAKGVEKTERESTSKLQNDDKADWVEAYSLFPGNVAYVWHASAFTDVVMEGLRKAGFVVKQQIIWNKNVHTLSRSDYHWKHEPCQPAGTMVRTPDGLVAIENLKDGDRVLSYDSYSSVITGKRDGRQIKVAKRNYDGEIYKITVGSLTTKTTDGHQFSIKYSKNASDIWCTYLMKRGKWWRIGILRAFNSRGFGLTVRLRQEQADEAWILGVYNSKSDAAVFENVLSIKYGIPTTCWSTDRNECLPHYRSEDQISLIYENLDLNLMRQNAIKCLSDYGRRLNYPFISSATCKEIVHSKRVTTIIRSCNLVKELMCVPVPKEIGDEFDWVTIKEVSREPFSGMVYSLDVEKDHHYVADGIVTHNCWYAVKPQGDRNWKGGRDQFTVWDIPSIMFEKDKTAHPTQKPVEIYSKALEHHTNPGEYVYDPFGGSGTLIIACEKLGRRALSMELDPKFVDLIVARWEQFTGKKATLIG